MHPYSFSYARRAAEHNSAVERLREASHRADLRRIQAQIDALKPPSLWARIRKAFTPR